MQDCVFCKIIAKEIPSKVVFESGSVLVIEDLVPKAEIHYLILPKKHVDDVRGLTVQDKNLAGELLLVAQELSDRNGHCPFRLLVNNGHEVGQRVYHLHIHFLAGDTLPELF